MKSVTTADVEAAIHAVVQEEKDAIRFRKVLREHVGKNLAAQTLGRLARGKPKHYSAAELALRSQRLALARLKRWPKKPA